MSLFGSLYSSVSALSAQSKSMSMISDNVANVNTTAYKGAVADFSSLVTRRPSSQAYSPGGVRAFTSYDVGQQGLIQSSSSTTDVAISGAGFFVVNRSNGNDGLPTEQLYTRDGSFEPDFMGNLRTPTGFYLQGWALDADENITDINQLETVNTRTIQGVAAATTQIDLGANLNADAEVYNDGTYVASGVGANNMSQYLAGQLQDPPVVAGMQPTFSRDVQIYDSLGRPRTVTMAFLREDPLTQPNQWHVEVFADPATVESGAGFHEDGLLATGTVNFNQDGSLQDPAVLVPYPAGGPAGQTLSVNWVDSNGAADSQITLSLGGINTTTGLTQFSSPSDVAFVTQNGAEVGELNGVRIDEEGYVVASFTNGEERKLYQLPVATFPNPGALDPRSGNVYSQTDVAGEFNLRFAGVGGAGTIAPSSLEAANVDIADEFSKMIVTQRAYSASSKIISTADQLLEELLRITR